MIDVDRPIARLGDVLGGTERIRTPVATCGTGADTPATRTARSTEAITRSLVGCTLADVERDLILDTLDHCLGNRTHAAKILGISIRTLRNKLSEYTTAGIMVPEPGQARTAMAALALAIRI